MWAHYKEFCEIIEFWLRLRFICYNRTILKLEKKSNMKQILILLLFVFELFGATMQTPLLSIDKESETITAKIEKIDVGVSGFLVKKIDDEHASILKNVVVVAFDEESKVATLQMHPFNALRNNALPTGKWEPQIGDIVELAFGYSRALLLAPSEEIYHQISKSVRVEWVHPDIFATLLSFEGHPTPLQSDFESFGVNASVGLLFLYLDKKVYTLDIQSFKILSISDAPLSQDSVVLPFYSRVEEIEANWFGEGSDELESYEPHYYELLVKNNKTNRKLYEIIKGGNVELHHLLDEFELGEKNDWYKTYRTF